jgi:hypothetical protein
MSNNKQSSVEWLFEQIARRQGSILQTIPFYDDNQDLLQQAKAMHKEEIVDATCLNDYVNEDDREIGERYYNETFGGNNEK